ncbi:MAG: sulfatase-like hydrolase/transferase [Bacteroidia bacterium]|nr:sulfatase-like hydrolase/transferase [Bacteroidia bacterium]
MALQDSVPPPLPGLRFRWMFWLLAGLANAAVFLPPYLSNFGNTHFFPHSTLEGASIGPWLSLFTRNNLDMFRISGEWLLLVSILLLIRRRPRLRSWWVAAASASFFVLLLYQTYFAVYVKLYGEHPMLISDLVLAWQVLPIYLGQITGGFWWMPLTAAGVLLLGSAVWLLMRTLSRLAGNLHLRWPVWAMLGLCWAFVAVSAWKNQRSVYRYDYHTSQWTSYLIAQSLRGGSLSKFEDLKGRTIYADYPNLPLEAKPDVYLLFVESYGRCAQTKWWSKDRYARLVQGLTDTLSMAGWNSASAYSLAPVLGGRSWLAFTSVMAGVKLDDQIQFNALLDRYPDFPHIIRYFQGQGYHTFRLKTFARQEASTDQAYAAQERFYGFDRWMKHHEIPYQGFPYDFNGGIPDQYGLGYARETAQAAGKPLMMFFISMGSHWPWFPPAPVTADWRQLDSIREDPYRIPADPRAASEYERYMARLEEKIYLRYLRTIEYELRMFVDFVLNTQNPNSVFLIMGDHQPPEITYYGGDGLETPVHLISRDTALIGSLLPYGFRRGLEADTTLPAPLKHEGLYSLMMRELLRQYGAEDRLPTYLPDGI